MKHIWFLSQIGLLCACGCLTACAGNTVYQPVEVKVPVEVQCKPPVVVHPAFPLKDVPTTASIFDKTRAALIEIDLRQIYEDQLNAAIKTCGG